MAMRGGGKGKVVKSLIILEVNHDILPKIDGSRSGRLNILYKTTDVSKGII